MKANLSLFILCLSLLACRSGRFDKSSIGERRLTNLIEPAQSWGMGPCQEKENCFQIQIDFEVRSNRGSFLAGELVHLEVLHPKLLSEPKMTAQSDARGIASFVLQFEEFPYERGSQYVTGFYIKTDKLGERFYSAVVEASKTQLPVSTFKDEVAANFKAQIRRNLPPIELFIDHVAVLGPDSKNNQLKKDLRIEVTGQLLEQTSSKDKSGVPFLLNLKSAILNQAFELQTNAKGQFKFEFELKHSPFLDEKIQWYDLSLKLRDREAPPLSFHFGLNMDTPEILVSSGSGPAPKADENSENPNLSLRPEFVDWTRQDLPYGLNPELRLIQNFKLEFLGQFLIHRNRLVHSPEDLKLSGLPIYGKAFVTRRGQILTSWTFDTNLDAEGRLSLTELASLSEFNFDSRELRLILALVLPELPEVVTSYFELSTPTEGRWLWKRLLHDEAQSLLKRDLLDLRRPSPSAPKAEVKLEEIFSSHIDLSKPEAKKFSDSNRREILQKLQAPILDSAVYWREILFLMQASESSVKRDQLNPNLLSVVEIIIPDEPFESQFLRSKELPLVRMLGDAQARVEEVSLKVRGTGKKCYSLMNNLNKTEKYFFCDSNSSQFDFEDHWYLIQATQADMKIQNLLLKELPRPFDLSKAQELDLFQHPEKFRPGIFARVVWPVQP